MNLLVQYAGYEWFCDISPSESATAVADWLGPWACRTTEQQPTCAGRVSLSVTAEPPDRQGGTRRPQVQISFEGCRISLNLADLPTSAVVSCSPATMVTAVRVVLRLLAMHRVVYDGGLILHASSVKTKKGIYLFAGKSGTGKTTAASTFPEADRLDDDLVFVAQRNGRWVRLKTFDPHEPRRFGPLDVVEPAVRAVFLPHRAKSFVAEILKAAAAVKACFHMPPPGLLPRSKITPHLAARILSAAGMLAAVVPVARFGWALGENLPELLECFLESTTSPA